MTATPLSRVLTRLEARIDWERRDRSTGWRVDLDPILDLVVRIGRPDRGMETCHVAGSKGKGSVASLLGVALSRAGQRVGVYGSPHVERIHERIRIEGVPVGDERLARALEAALDAVDAGERESTAAGDASWFDIVTAAALWAFRDAGVDWAVLEVGLGGRLDSTNVIDPPALAVVTMIALEHTGVLGSTHSAIAAEKGGIVKTGSRLVTGCDPRSEAGAELAGIATAHGVPHVVAWTAEDSTFEQSNVRVARAGLDLLGTAFEGIDAQLLDDAAIQAARLPGRMEWLDAGGVPVLLDGAHVPESLERALAEARARESGPFAAVVALHREKDAEALLTPLLGTAAGKLFATTIPGSGVHLAASDVAEAASHLGIEVTAIEDPTAALTAALDWARTRPGPPRAWVLGTGSLYLVGALRPALSVPQ